MPRPPAAFARRPRRPPPARRSPRSRGAGRGPPRGPLRWTDPAGRARRPSTVPVRPSPAPEHTATGCPARSASSIAAVAASSWAGVGAAKSATGSPSTRRPARAAPSAGQGPPPDVHHQPHARRSEGLEGVRRPGPGRPSELAGQQPAEVGEHKPPALGLGQGILCATAERGRREALPERRVAPRAVEDRPQGAARATRRAPHGLLLWPVRRPPGRRHRAVAGGAVGGARGVGGDHHRPSPAPSPQDTPPVRATWPAARQPWTRPPRIVQSLIHSASRHRRGADTTATGPALRTPRTRSRRNTRKEGAPCLRSRSRNWSATAR